MEGITLSIDIFTGKESKFTIIESAPSFSKVKTAFATAAAPVLAAVNRSETKLASLETAVVVLESSQSQAVKIIDNKTITKICNG
jgi:hypothetical protein